MKIFKISEIATIQIGHSFRVSLNHWPAGKIPVIQMKDIPDSGEIDLTTLAQIGMWDLNPNHVVQEGDLIFRSRGLKTNSIVVPKCQGEVVLSAPLFRLRVQKADIQPAYLSWYINQPKAQAYLEKIAEGSAQKMISKENLMEMPVEMPSLDRQKMILGIIFLSGKEKILREAIAEKREKLIGAKLAQIIEEA